MTITFKILVLTSFRQLLIQITRVHTSAGQTFICTFVAHASNTRRTFRREFEVIHIPSNVEESGVVHVFTTPSDEYHVSDEDEGDISFDEIRNVSYECVEMSTNMVTLVAIVCEDIEMDKEEHFVRKCCPPGMRLERDHLGCQEDSETGVWIAPRNILHHRTLTMIGEGRANITTIDPEVTKCAPDEILTSGTFHSVLTNGSLYPTLSGSAPVSYVCVDQASSGGTHTGDVTWVAMTCQQSPGVRRTCLDPHGDTLRRVYTASAVLSTLFLVITAIVYIKLPELGNLHGRIVLSNVITITLVTLYLLLVYNASHLLSNSLCVLIGHLGYFLTISMFSWMTVLSFDLFWTFSNARCRKMLIYV